jgi:hypothetical protein
MSKRFAILIGVAALGAAVMAAGASADFTSVHDRRGDTGCHHDGGSTTPCSNSVRRNADIVRATAGHDRRWLKHTIRVVGKFHAGEITINTDSDPTCEYYLYFDRAYFDRGVGRVKVHQSAGGCPRPGGVTGHARVDVHRHSVEVFFSKRSIGNPQSYGWQVFAFAGGRSWAADLVPNHEPGYIQHRLGGSGVAAAGARALGAQTAAAPDVVKYDTTLYLTKEGGPNYHGSVMSDRDRNPVFDPATAVRKCMEGRRVVVFKVRPGADRKLGTARSEFDPRDHNRNLPAFWWLDVDRGFRGAFLHIRAKVTRKVRDRYVCRADYAPFSD